MTEPSTGSESNVKLCAAYNGAYDCWRKAGHKGEHRHYCRAYGRTYYLAWWGTFDEMTHYPINF